MAATRRPDPSKENRLWAALGPAPRAARDPTQTGSLTPLDRNSTSLRLVLQDTERLVQGFSKNLDKLFVDTREAVRAVSDISTAIVGSREETVAEIKNHANAHHLALKEDLEYGKAGQAEVVAAMDYVNKRLDRIEQESSSLSKTVNHLSQQFSSALLPIPPKIDTFPLLIEQSRSELEKRLLEMEGRLQEKIHLLEKSVMWAVPPLSEHQLPRVSPSRSRPMRHSRQFDLVPAAPPTHSSGRVSSNRLANSVSSAVPDTSFSLTTDQYSSRRRLQPPRTLSMLQSARRVSHGDSPTNSLVDLDALRLRSSSPDEAHSRSLPLAVSVPVHLTALSLPGSRKLGLYSSADQSRIMPPQIASSPAASNNSEKSADPSPSLSPPRKRRRLSPPDLLPPSAPHSHSSSISLPSDEHINRTSLSPSLDRWSLSRNAGSHGFANASPLLKPTSAPLALGSNIQKDLEEFDLMRDRGADGSNAPGDTNHDGAGVDQSIDEVRDRNSGCKEVFLREEDDLEIDWLF